MRKFLQSRWLLPAILTLAFALRVSAGAWWQARLPEGQKFGFPDSESYWQLGRTIATFDDYRFGDYQIFRTPGYPALLAPLFWYWDEPPALAARVESALFGTAAVALVSLLARLLFDRTAQMLAALITALYPGAIALSFVVLSEAPFCPLLVGQLLCWTLAWRAGARHQRLGWALAAGVCAGLATLMRPSWLLFTPFALTIGVIFFSLRLKQLEVGGLMLLTLVVTMSPWWIRNYEISGRFVPTTLQVGPSLYDGISPDATGASDMRFVERFLIELDPARQGTLFNPLGPKLEGIDLEIALDSTMSTAALDWAANNPRHVIQLAAIKFFRLWNIWPNASEFRSVWIRLAVAAGYVPVLAASIYGAWRFARREWPYFLCLLPAVYLTLLHIVFVSSIRYREPAMLPLIVLAAGAIAARVFVTADSSSPASGNTRACIGS